MVIYYVYMTIYRHKIFDINNSNTVQLLVILLLALSCCIFKNVFCDNITMSPKLGYVYNYINTQYRPTQSLFGVVIILND